jgi:hypothetical protein
MTLYIGAVMGFLVGWVLRSGWLVRGDRDLAQMYLSEEQIECPECGEYVWVELPEENDN